MKYDVYSNVLIFSILKFEKLYNINLNNLDF
jgi:hypothetical protein